MKLQQMIMLLNLQFVQQVQKWLKEKEKKKKSKASEEYEELKASTCRRLSLIEEFNNNQLKEQEIKQREQEMKQRDQDLSILMADTTIMNETQREIHAKLLAEVKRRL